MINWHDGNTRNCKRSFTCLDQSLVTVARTNYMLSFVRPSNEIFLKRLSCQKITYHDIYACTCNFEVII